MLRTAPQSTQSLGGPLSVPSRLVSLDVLRGLTIAAMILVTDPSTWDHAFHQLTHAPWNDPTAADLIFPCFLLVVGMSMTLSFAARLSRGATRHVLTLHVLRRTAWLIALGLAVNAFPSFDLATVRIPGILQRIGACYLIVSMVYLALSGPAWTKSLRNTALAIVGAACLGLYWFLLKMYPTPGFGPGRLDPLGDVAAVLDRAVFTVPHLFQYGVRTPGVGITFDPEGILSTLGALGTTFCGVLAGEELRSTRSRRQQCAVLATAGTALWLLSLGLWHWMPINKQIYTPPFALWSAGLVLIAFAALCFVIDVLQLRRGWTLALIFGTNAIFAFCVSQLVTNLFNLWHVNLPAGRFTLHEALGQVLLDPWLPLPVASLVFAIGIVLLNALLIYPLYRKRVFLRL